MFAHGGAPTLVGASVPPVLPSCVQAGAKVCSGGGRTKGRALKCFRNSRKVKTGLSPKKTPCKNLLCLRGAQGGAGDLVRNKTKCLFRYLEFERKGTLGPGQTCPRPSAGPCGHQLVTQWASPPTAPPHTRDRDPATLKTQAFHPGLAVHAAGGRGPGSEDTQRRGDGLLPPRSRPETQKMVGVSTLFDAPKSRDVPSCEETVRAPAPSSCGGAE